MFVYLTRSENKNIGKWINISQIEQIGYLYAKETNCGEYQLGMCIGGECFFLTDEQYSEIMEQILELKHTKG